MLKMSDKNFRELYTYAANALHKGDPVIYFLS